MISAKPSSATVPEFLIRYGAIPEVGRFGLASVDIQCERGQRVVVESHRGCEIGTVLEQTKSSATDEVASAMTILRVATEDDLRLYTQLQDEARAEFDRWIERITEWKLDLELIELEWMFDRAKLVLYVLNERGGDCTKLALFAAAGGLGTVEVQPVNAEGLVQMPQVGGGGCGSGGGGCGSCGTD